jgi:arylsulfatase A-like enzyme
VTDVLIVVFDGLQPAQVTPELMPNLSRFAEEGVFFANHHPVFPTVTRVNAASMVTGRYPGGHGLAGNTMVARDYDPDRVIPAMEPVLADLAKTTGQVLLAPTLADILSCHGAEYVAIGAGTSGNAYVHNPRADVSGGATIHPEFTLPAPLYERLVSRFGPWPDESLPNTPRFARAAQILTEHILPEMAPAVALIWSSEPDKSQHAAGVGSDLANAALGEADSCFGGLLDWIETTGRSGEVDVMVLSDHGYSTISECVDVESQVRDAGFPDGGVSGGVLVATNGGCVLFYVHRSDVDTTRRLATWLMARPWCGALLSADELGSIDGALPASLLGPVGPRSPELTMSFRWEPRTNAAGYPGFAYSTSGAPGLGQHGAMTRHEMRNTLIARGPRFKRGVRVESPSGNVDVAPTVLRILGLSAGMDGRVLEEALDGRPDGVEWSSETHRAERRLASGVFRQQVVLSSVGETTYVDEGNATFE